MKSLRLAISLDEETVSPEQNLAYASTAIDRHLILGGGVYDGMETTISYVEGDPDAADEILREVPEIEEYELAPGEDGCFLYCRQALTDSAMTLFEAFHRDTVVVVPPYELRSDGTVRMDVVGTPEDLQAVIDGFPDGNSVDVVRVGDHAAGPIGELSARQREAVRTAWEVGYYEVPREGGIEAVAEALECAVSTASDLLRRAESRLVANALDAPR
ncbi:helix-turn-helix domain-containing protein [Halovivax sp.]|uniref:helix-turn-helix domain-containing protein n=1 Tax=Halovivax sp. TaxID=1935978 RepID=UPI0025BDF7F8|nr:helix-turn-helix domain-containing protein [Halovivax sp.]